MIELHCGDCLEILPTLEANSVDAVITDPPYGARRPSARRSADARFEEIIGNDRPRTEWLGSAVGALVEGGAFYLFTCWDRLEEWRAAMGSVGLRVRSCIVWDKMIHGLADPKTCWAPQYELILFGAKGRHELRGKRPADVIRCQRLRRSSMVHPYQKPEQLLGRLIQASTEEGDTILDPFCGSGTTGIEAVRSGRNFIGIEIDPKHFATAQSRIAAEQARTPLFANP